MRTVLVDGGVLTGSAARLLIRMRLQHTVGSQLVFLGLCNARDLCDPAGTWFSTNDRGRHQPLTVIQNDAAQSGCLDPHLVHQSYLASALHAWQNDSLCIYRNGSLWYQQHPHGDAGEFGAVKQAEHCDSLRWADGDLPPFNGAEWCRGTSTTCLGPAPAPLPPPTPSPWLEYQVPTTSVAINSSDPSSALLAMFIKGEQLAAGNIKPFRQGGQGQRPVEVMVEGEEYRSAWIETQPMAGAMYAQRNVRVALNNQLIFMRSARSDGFMAHRVDANPSGESLKPVYFCGGDTPGIQGLYLAYPSVDVAFFLNLSYSTQSDSTVAMQYLHELRDGLAAYDRWMWTNRNDSQCCSLHSTAINASCCPSTPSPGSGDWLWSSGVVDTGEDGSDKFALNAKGAIQSMDMLGYSISARRSLARIARLLGDTEAEAEWGAKADVVAAKLKSTLWRPDMKACFDKDINGKWVTTLVHNNLRMMWHGAYDQEMADHFVSTHLMNRKEFFTRAPLTSIAISDKRFQDKKGNNWSGPLEGLTAQRAIRALENYGHHAESVLIGLALTAALLPRTIDGKAVGGNFPQQIDPFTAIPEQGDGYGPMIMSFLEYTALRLGIVPRPDRNALLWSGLQPIGATASYSYTQRLSDHNFTLALEPSGVFTGTRNGQPLFRASGGVRVLTDLAGVVTEVWGIANTTRAITVGSGTARGALLHMTVAPNEEWQVDLSATPPTSRRVRTTPFYPPFG